MSTDVAPAELLHRFREHLDRKQLPKVTTTTQNHSDSTQRWARKRLQKKPATRFAGPTAYHRYRESLQPGQITTYDSIYFGHPHDQGPPQSKETFWHQYPSWTLPEYQLYYYGPAYGGYLDHPLYTVRVDERQLATIGYGTRQRFQKTRPDHRDVHEPLAKGCRHFEMVDVYNGHDFVHAVPLEVLTRFSNAARRVFSTQREKPSAALSPRLMTVPDWVERVATAGKEAAITEEPPAKEQPTAPVSLARARQAAGRKELHLQLDVVEMPSPNAVRVALKWILDNRGHQELLDYAPPSLDRISLTELIDFYQAALALELRPWSRALRVKRAILERVSTTYLDLQTFGRIVYWLPVEDSIIARCINTIENRQASYGESALKEYRRFLRLSGNEELLARYHDILAYRAERVVTHHVNREDFPLSRPISPSNQAVPSSEAESSPEKSKRRRNRRQKQAMGKEKADGAQG